MHIRIQNIWVSMKESNPYRYHLHHAPPAKYVDYYAVIIFMKYEWKLLTVDGSICKKFLSHCLLHSVLLARCQFLSHFRGHHHIILKMTVPSEALRLFYHIMDGMEGEDTIIQRMIDIKNISCTFELKLSWNSVTSMENLLVCFFRNGCWYSRSLLACGNCRRTSSTYIEALENY